MSAPASYTMESTAPVFPVTDMPRAVRYYVDVLQFAIGFEWADAEGDPIRYTILHHGDVGIHLTTTQTPRQAAAYVFVRGVREYYSAVTAAGALINQPLQDWPWDMREFQLADPDGNLLIFGEDIGHAAPHAAEAASD